MGKHLFWKVTLGLITLCLYFRSQELYSAQLQVGTLSEGSCWYENKDLLKVASFNDKSVYLASRGQIESQLNELLVHTFKDAQQKINEMDLTLHCGGYGASLVAKVTTDSNTLCIWSRFEKGALALRSIGVVSEQQKNPNELCSGHKWGEFILGVQSSEFLNELQDPKWSSMIKEITAVTDRVYKVTLVKDFEFRESEVANLLEENFTGKNFIRYIEYNDYRHPVGEYLHLGK